MRLAIIKSNSLIIHPVSLLSNPQRQSSSHRMPADFNISQGTETFPNNLLFSGRMKRLYAKIELKAVRYGERAEQIVQLFQLGFTGETLHLNIFV